jgi:hypothetical protein
LPGSVMILPLTAHGEAPEPPEALRHIGACPALHLPAGAGHRQKLRAHGSEDGLRLHGGEIRDLDPNHRSESSRAFRYITAACYGRCFLSKRIPMV